MIFLLALQPRSGLLGERVGRRPLLIFYGVGGLFYTDILLTFLPQTQLTGVGLRPLKAEGAT